MPAPPVPQLEPTSLVAGDTAIWQRSFSDYPISDGWALSYAANGLGKLPWDVGFVANDGTTFTVTIPANITSELQPGPYELTAILTGSGAFAGQRKALKCATLVVRPDPASQNAGDRVSHAAELLPIVEDALKGRLSADMERYMIHGREVQKIPYQELRKLRASLRAELWEENHPGQSAPSRKVYFARA